MSALDKINAYVTAGFVRHTSDYEIAVPARQLAKWWLELVRNILVVAGLYYLADKSGSTPLKIFSYINVAVLGWYMSSHFNTWSFRLFPYIKNRRMNIAVNTTLWLVLYGCAWVGCIYAGVLIFKSLAVLQPK